MNYKKMKCKRVIAQVRKSKHSRQKTVTIPKSARHIKAGDYILVRKIRR